MSCNPAIGGLGKGHLVREIDALDGIMGTAADFSGIQFRLLNRRKGPAVQGPRVQADRKRYMQSIQSILSNYRNLTFVAGEVIDLIISGDRVGGVVLGSGEKITCDAVILTTGHFCAGRCSSAMCRMRLGVWEMTHLSNLPSVSTILAFSLVD